MMKNRYSEALIYGVCLLLWAATQESHAHFSSTPDSPVHITEEETLVFKSEANGDRVPDFSYSGYKASESPIPNIPIQVIVPAMASDATQTIQSAIDHVSNLPMGEDGFRGAVLLESGTYTLSGSLKIAASGVVLTGSGSDENGTVLLAAGVDRATLIRVSGKADRTLSEPITIAKRYHPVNATELFFDNEPPFQVGDQVIVNRPSTQEWIERIGADKIGFFVDYQLTHWEPGDFDIKWDRAVVAVSANSITIDAPITNSLDPEFGGGSVARYTDEGRIRNVGIENVRCVSTFDKSNPKDENHRWMAITMENLCDGWVRRVIAENFVSSAVAIWDTAKRITVEDCKSLSPIGEIGNYRRYAFQTEGQQTLFQRCYAEYAYRAFSVGFTVPGPNAFVQCYSHLPYEFSGTNGGWASGVLFDKVTIDGGNIHFAFRDADGQGGGWSTANSLAWQCRAAQIHLSKPPMAQNWAIGSWAQGYGNGHHELPHTFITPESLFYAQLEARTGKKSPETEKILIYESSGSSRPTPETAAQHSLRSKSPDLTIDEWIDRIITSYPISNDSRQAIEWNRLDPVPSEKKRIPARLENGRFVRANALLNGDRNRTALWRGSTRPRALNDPRPHLTRFVPGRVGRGLTDDLDTLVSDMLDRDIVAMQHFPALWYERRRDDHARTRRVDADVWAPFYEQPFSRSGKGEAFDRLSKYDLDQWNPWYWTRVKQFANRADENGLLFIQEHYQQHNIIEEGAHWVDYPWRSANNINDLGFAENPAYAGDKRVYMAEEFYDTSHPVRRKYHRHYIRKHLDSFADNRNAIHHLGKEYTGPLHFVEFWLDVISEWEKENDQDVLAMLPGTKDVQDAILADPQRSNTVEIIDVVQWHYRNDGSLYAPTGGVSLAGRQYARIHDVGTTSFHQIHRAIREFREKNPNQAIVYSRRIDTLEQWAVFLGGGSLADLPIQDKAFHEAAYAMTPMERKDPESRQYAMGKNGFGYIILSMSPEIIVDLTNDDSAYEIEWIDPNNGATEPNGVKIVGNQKTTIESPFDGPSVAWLSKN